MSNTMSIQMNGSGAFSKVYIACFFNRNGFEAFTTANRFYFVIPGFWTGPRKFKHR